MKITIDETKAKRTIPGGELVAFVMAKDEVRFTIKRPADNWRPPEAGGKQYIEVQMDDATFKQIAEAYIGFRQQNA